MRKFINIISETIAEDVWHGSHSKHERFSIDYAGTGSGAEAYGWGLYFTSKKSLAQFYTNMPSYLVDGKIVRVSTWEDLPNTPEDYAAKAMYSIGKYAIFTLQKAATDGDYRFPDQDMAQKAYELVRDGKCTENKGTLYEVSIPDDHYLDWDEPLGKQPEFVLEKVKILIAEHHIKTMNSNTKGGVFYIALARGLGSFKDASLALKRVGVAGNTYIDGGDGFDTGARNYVVFDDENIQIKTSK